jgi:hypothetical protein
MKLPEMKSLWIFCTFVFAVNGKGVLAQTTLWPTIRALHTSYTFIEPERGKDTPFLAFIESASGEPVYKFECHNGNYEDESEINFSGDFHCALFAVKGNRVTSADLLAADTKDERSTDWWNRGRVLSRQFRGDCLAYPEYSALRHFELRDMLITLRFTQVEWSDTRDQQGNPLLARFTFALDVVSDQTAQSAAAEPPRGPTPPRACYP